jgi:hypothetical protein
VASIEVTTDTVPEALKQDEELIWYTVLETCDVCPSQSYFMVVLESGNLFFCNHHFKKNEAVIFEGALDIVDESELLLRR